jgi:hypothetical protein
MAIDELLNGSKAQIGAPADTCDVKSRRRAPLMRKLSMRIDSTNTASWPMLLSRPFVDPNDPGLRHLTKDERAAIRVKQAVISQRPIASHKRHSVTFTATGPVRPAPQPTGAVAAVDIGWRRLTDGLRVATIVRNTGKPPDYIICPERIISRLEYVETLRSRRDEARNAILARVCAIDWTAAPEMLAEIGLRLRMRPASSFGRLAVLALTWRKYPDWRPDDFAAVEQWRRRDKSCWEEEANLRDKAIAARDDHYRKEAVRILDGVTTLILEDFDIAAAARLEDKSGDETTQVAAMRRYRTIAAPGELRRWLIIQAQKRGVVIHTHEGVSNDPHAVCGTKHAVPDKTALRRYCPHCGGYYDVDINACEVMLAVYEGSEPLAAE